MMVTARYRILFQILPKILEFWQKLAVGWPYPPCWQIKDINDSNHRLIRYAALNTLLLSRRLVLQFPPVSGCDHIWFQLSLRKDNIILNQIIDSL